jgi:hypothetical protein
MVLLACVLCQNDWNSRKFADSSNGSEKVEKAVEPVEHIDTFPIEVLFPCYQQTCVSSNDLPNRAIRFAAPA